MNAQTASFDMEPEVEIRSNARVSGFLLAYLEIGGVSWPVCLRNLSAQGALVEAEAGFLIGSEVIFRRAFAAIPARVVWARGWQFGLEFERHLRPEEVRTLSRRVNSPHQQPLPTA